MVIFATPDFGAGATVGCFVLIAYLIAYALALGGLYWGLTLIGKKSPSVRKCGVILMVISGAAPFFCCLAPPIMVRMEYGNFPIEGDPYSKISEGMSKDEVQAILGTPHGRNEDDKGETWHYWRDSFGINWFGVRFNPNGRVDHTYGN